jgi:hypothetical protein
MNPFFVDEELEDESPKRRKLEPYSDDESDCGLSDSSEGDLEDIPLQANQPDNFTIQILPLKSSNEKKLRALEDRRKKLSIHYLGMVSYLLHVHIRNRWMCQKAVVKTLRKNLPETITKKIAKLKKRIRTTENTDKEKVKSTSGTTEDIYSQLRYVINYLVKWFRHNYEIVSTGIRVLGYLPNGVNDSKYSDYYSNKCPPLSAESFAKVCKSFKHNRDTGAQIFTALLRSIGFEARLVFSLPLLAVSKSSKTAPKLDYEKLERVKDCDLLFPYFWTELVDPIDPSKLFIIETMCFHDKDKRVQHLGRSLDSLLSSFTAEFYPEYSEFNSMQMSHVVSIGENGGMIDVSARYMADISYRYFNRLDLRTILGRSELLFQSLLRYFNRNDRYTAAENEELSTLRKLALRNYSIPTSYAAMKRSPNFITRTTLRFNEEISPTARSVGTIKLQSKEATVEKQKVYSRSAVMVGRSEQHWKQLGRSIKPEFASKPMKVTTSLRSWKSRQNNEPAMPTNLYTLSQTTIYVPPLVYEKNGVLFLPRNQYGNIEIYRPWMVPKKAKWLTLSDIESILSRYRKSLFFCPIEEDIEYVPVVVGFEYVSRNGQAVPVKNGVIVHENQENAAKKIWLYGMADKQHSLKMEAELQALQKWRTLVRALRVKAKLDKRYGSG